MAELAMTIPTAGMVNLINVASAAATAHFIGCRCRCRSSGQDRKRSDMMKTRTQEMYEASQHEQMLKRVAQEGAREKWRLERATTQGHIVDSLALTLLIGAGWMLWHILRLTCKGLYLAVKYVIARFRNHPVSP